MASRPPDEIARNPRARSAILRAGQRTAAEPRPLSYAGLAVPGARGAYPAPNPSDSRWTGCSSSLGVSAFNVFVFC